LSLSSALACKVLMKCEYEIKKIPQNLIWVSAIAEFHADFRSVGKVVEKCTKKHYYQKRDRNTDFSTFIFVSQTGLLIIVVCAFF
jgi:hypothetical protein